MEVSGVLAGRGIGAKGAAWAGVGAGGVGGGQLAHHEMPRGVPGGADGGDEELGREGLAPEEVGDG